MNKQPRQKVKSDNGDLVTKEMGEAMDHKDPTDISDRKNTPNKQKNYKIDDHGYVSSKRKPHKRTESWSNPKINNLVFNNQNDRENELDGNAEFAQTNIRKAAPRVPNLNLKQISIANIVENSNEDDNHVQSGEQKRGSRIYVDNEEISRKEILEFITFKKAREREMKEGGALEEVEGELGDLKKARIMKERELVKPFISHLRCLSLVLKEALQVFEQSAVLKGDVGVITRELPEIFEVIERQNDPEFVRKVKPTLKLTGQKCLNLVRNTLIKSRKLLNRNVKTIKNLEAENKDLTQRFENMNTRYQEILGIYEKNSNQTEKAKRQFLSFQLKLNTILPDNLKISGVTRSSKIKFDKIFLSNFENQLNEVTTQNTLMKETLTDLAKLTNKKVEEKNQRTHLESLESFHKEETIKEMKDWLSIYINQIGSLSLQGTEQKQFIRRMEDNLFESPIQLDTNEPSRGLFVGKKLTYGEEEESYMDPECYDDGKMDISQMEKIIKRNLEVQEAKDTEKRGFETYIRIFERMDMCSFSEGGSKIFEIHNCLYKIRDEFVNSFEIEINQLRETGKILLEEVKKISEEKNAKKKEIETLSNEKIDIEKTIKESKDRVKTLKERIKDVQGVDRKKLTQETTSELESIQGKIDDKSRSIAKMEATLLEKISEIDGHVRDLNEIQARVTKKTNEIAQTTKDISIINTRKNYSVEKMNEILEESSNRCKDLFDSGLITPEENLDTIDKNVVITCTYIKEIKDREERIGDLEARLESQGTLQGLIDGLNEEIKKMKEVESRLQGRIKSLESSNKDINEKNHELQIQAANEIEKSHTNEIKSYQTAKENEKLGKEIAELQLRIDASEQELQEQKALYDNMMSQWKAEIKRYNTKREEDKKQFDVSIQEGRKRKAEFESKMTDLRNRESALRLREKELEGKLKGVGVYERALREKEEMLEEQIQSGKVMTIVVGGQEEEKQAIEKEDAGNGNGNEISSEADKNQQGQSTNNQPTASLFGNNNIQKVGGLFGNNNTTSPNVTTGGLFDTNNQAEPEMEEENTGGIFGTNTTGLFGNNNLAGATDGPNLFGNNNQPPAEEAKEETTSSLFSSNKPGLFGNNEQQGTGLQDTNPVSLFSSNDAQVGGLFNNTGTAAQVETDTPTSLFSGNNQQQPAETKPGASLFDSGSMFSSNNKQEMSLFSSNKVEVIEEVDEEGSEEYIDTTDNRILFDSQVQEEEVNPMPGFSMFSSNKITVEFPKTGNGGSPTNEEETEELAFNEKKTSIIIIDPEISPSLARDDKETGNYLYESIYEVGPSCRMESSEYHSGSKLAELAQREREIRELSAKYMKLKQECASISQAVISKDKEIAAITEEYVGRVKRLETSNQDLGLKIEQYKASLCIPYEDCCQPSYIRNMKYYVAMLILFNIILYIIFKRYL